MYLQIGNVLKICHFYHLAPSYWRCKHKKHGVLVTFRVFPIIPGQSMHTHIIGTANGLQHIANLWKHPQLTCLTVLKRPLYYFRIAAKKKKNKDHYLNICHLHENALSVFISHCRYSKMTGSMQCTSNAVQLVPLKNKISITENLLISVQQYNIFYLNFWWKFDQ
jgi:hypothetical protein